MNENTENLDKVQNIMVNSDIVTKISSSQKIKKCYNLLIELSYKYRNIKNTFYQFILNIFNLVIKINQIQIIFITRYFYILIYMSNYVRINLLIY
jgi:hypothetical protein